MTRDEFMDLVYDELYSDGDNNRANRIIDAADSYAEDCEPHWIPCDEKMPENEATVLVTVAPPGIEPKVLEMSYSNGHWYRNDMLISPRWVVVAAWMPMPKPYFKGVLCGEAFEEENESSVL